MTGVVLCHITGPGWLNELGSWITKQLMPIINMAWVRARLCKLQKGCTRMKIFKHFETYTSFIFQTCLMYITIYNLEHLTEVVWSLLQL